MVSEIFNMSSSMIELLAQQLMSEHVDNLLTADVSSEGGEIHRNEAK